MIIGITGTSGVGKTTIVKELKKKLSSSGYTVYTVNEIILNNPIFKEFNTNVREWSFEMELSSLLERFKQWFNLSKEDDANKIIIFDRMFLDDIIFTKCNFINKNIGEKENKILESLFKNCLSLYEEGNIIKNIFLIKASFENVIKRIEKRNRIEEINMPLENWKELYEKYYYNEEIYSYFKNSTNSFDTIETDDNNIERAANEILKIIDIDLGN